MLENIMDNYPEEDFLIADGLNDAIIGVDEKSMRLIYSVSSVIDILMQQGMSDTDALEYFYFNIDGAYMGDKTPIWCHDIY
jgi:hypothetical protein